MARKRVRSISLAAWRTIRKILSQFLNMKATGAAQIIKTNAGPIIHVPKFNPEVYWYGIVTDAGPNDEDNFTDHRYWIRKAIPDNADGIADTNAPTTFGQTPRASASRIPENATSPNISEAADLPLPEEIVAATNLAEGITAADPNTGPHMLPIGTPVKVFVGYDQSERKVRRYFFAQTSPHVSFPVRIKVENPLATGTCNDSGAGTTCGFSYEVYDLYQTDPPIATAKIPWRPRVPNIEYHVPDDYSFAFAFWDQAGILQLAHVLEERPKLHTGDEPLGNNKTGHFTEGLLACVSEGSGSGSGSSSGSSSSGGGGCTGQTATVDNIDLFTCITEAITGCIIPVTRNSPLIFVDGCYQGKGATEITIHSDCKLLPCENGSGSGSGSGGSTAVKYEPCDPDAGLDDLYFDPTSENLYDVIKYES